jgi:hypothetical protein
MRGDYLMALSLFKKGHDFKKSSVRSLQIFAIFAFCDLRFTTMAEKTMNRFFRKKMKKKSF